MNAGFGQDFFPDNVLGPPNGGDPHNPNASEHDLLTLGTGGSIILEFSTHRVIDGPGPDFTIFENPVQPYGFPEQTFADTAIVAVSPNAETWYTFPFDLVSSDEAALRLKSNYIGFAGIEPTFSSPDNGISPFDPAASGGDQFDLADLGLSAIRFIRITDSGHALHNPQYDIDNDLVTDYGNLIDPPPDMPGVGISAGFDLDAVAAIHTEPWNPSTVTDWSIYQ